MPHPLTGFELPPEPPTDHDEARALLGRVLADACAGMMHTVAYTQLATVYASHGNIAAATKCLELGAAPLPRPYTPMFEAPGDPMPEGPRDPKAYVVSDDVACGCIGPLGQNLSIGDGKPHLHYPHCEGRLQTKS